MKTTEPTNSFIPPKRRMLLGMRRSAWLELLLALGFLLLLDMLALDRTRYWHANPHPFWFVVLLLAGKYGTKEGVLAALFASAALLIGNMPEQLPSQDSYAYALHVLKLPLLWLVSAVIFGELRQMHIRERNRLEHDLIESEEREQHITQSYEWVRQLKDQLELRMAGQLRSSISAYHAAKSMESLDPTQVMSGLEELVKSTLHPMQFSVYTLSGEELSVVLTHGWSESDAYGRTYGSSSPLYRAIVGEQNILCVANNQHERLLAGQGMLAGPLYDRESGVVVGMLKIEKLGFSDLNLSNIEAFSTLCEWAGLAIVNARKYEKARQESMVNPEHNLLTPGYFTHFSRFISSLAKRVGFDVAAINVKLANSNDFDSETNMRIARALSESVDTVLRNVDLAFDHQENREHFSIVLPATPQAGAEIVLRKIEAQLAKRVSSIAGNASFSYSVQMLYEKSTSK